MQVVHLVAQREDRRAAETVDGVERVCRREQPLRLVLRDDVDQRAGQLAQLARARRQAVDAALRPPRGEHFALHDEVVVVGEREARLRQPFAQRCAGRDLEHGARAIGALAHGVAVGAAAERERQTAEQHRLARARLAGNHRQARRRMSISARSIKPTFSIDNRSSAVGPFTF